MTEAGAYTCLNCHEGGHVEKDCPKAVKSVDTWTTVFHTPKWEAAELPLHNHGGTKMGFICTHQLENGRGQCGGSVFHLANAVGQHSCQVKNYDPYPQHTKMASRRTDLDAASDFYDFLQSEGISLVIYEGANRDRFACSAPSVRRLLAKWIGVDEDALEVEKRAMLDALRAANESSTPSSPQE